MLRRRPRVPGRAKVLLPALLFFFLVAGARSELTAQEPPPEAVEGEEQLPHAEEVLKAGLAEAEKDGRLVFLHTGADW